MLVDHFLYVYERFKQTLDNLSGWGDFYTEELEFVDVRALQIERYTLRYKPQHHKICFRIAVDDYVVFDGFDTWEQAREILIFMQDSEILFT